MRWISYLFFAALIVLLFLYLVLVRVLSEIFEAFRRPLNGPLCQVRVRALATAEDEWGQVDAFARFGVRGSTGGGYSAGPPAQVRVMGQLRLRAIRKLKRRQDVIAVEELHRYAWRETVTEHALRLAPFITPL